MPKREDFTGQKFGFWTVIKFHEKRNGKSCWICKCECGNVKSVLAESFKHGRSISCGCAMRAMTSKRFKKHGEKETRLYRCWSGIKSRIYNTANKEYHNYGGRGITMCEEWHEFIPFRDWALLNGYEEHLTIDRIDVNGNYEPDNCMWATWEQQANNTRRNIFITYQDETLTLSQWARRFNMDNELVRIRIYKFGWPFEKAITTPSQNKNGRKQNDSNKT